MSAFPYHAVAVTPNDSTDLPTPGSLYIGVSGDVAVILNGPGESSVVFKNHPIGYLPAQVKRVLATNTTATNILLLV